MQFPQITKDRPALVLAPMEGVTDAPMRALLTERGGFTFCVSEFIRISQDLLPPHVFQTHIPELKTDCRTATRTPIQIQLLGGDEEKMALNARRACELGARAIDINFGCPSPRVNHHDGGAALLRFPLRIKGIVAAVRAAVPSSIPVSAKLRLGWENMEDIYVNAEQAARGGASWITIHARTKVQGYAPPAHWKYINEVRKNLDIPVVANGEIWTLDDFKRCQDETECQHFMIGRGALGNPSLPHEIAQSLKIINSVGNFGPFTQTPKEWDPILTRFAEITAPVAQTSNYTARRIKQWLKFATVKHSLPWFDEVKRANDLEELMCLLRKL